MCGGGIDRRRGAQDEGVTGAKIMTRGSMRGSNPRPHNIGLSPNGKATGFDPVIVPVRIRVALISVLLR